MHIEDFHSLPIMQFCLYPQHPAPRHVPQRFLVCVDVPLPSLCCLEDLPIPMMPTATPQAQCWRPGSPVTVPSTAKHSAVSLSCSRLGPSRWPAPTDGAFVRDLDLPLFSLAEHSVGAGMMTGVFVLLSSTWRRFSAAPAEAGDEKAVAPKHNACAAPVATGVPKGRALGPGAGVELPATGSMLLGRKHGNPLTRR
jgi:hypothetical protein